MDQPTRRFDQPMPDPGTQQMVAPVPTGPPCIRCQTEMMATTAYAAGRYPGEMRLFMRDARGGIFTPAPSTALDTMTCPRCGYTEFFARSLEQLNEMIRARQLQEEETDNG